MTPPRSKVDRLARSLNRMALVLFGLFLVAAVASVAWVHDEWDPGAPAWRYVIAVSSTSGFLIAAVLARVGAALVLTLARVRASLIDAILDSDEDEADAVFEMRETTVGHR